MSSGPWREFPEQQIRIYAPTQVGGRFRILFRDSAGQERERSGGKTEREALQRAQQLAKEQAAGLDGTWTVGKLLDEYLKPMNHRTRQGRPWSGRYAQEEERRVRLHIRPHLNVRAPAQRLGPQDFIRILNAATEHGRAPATVETIGKTCRAIVSYGQRMRALDGDPMLGVHYHVAVSQQDGDVRRVNPRTIPTLDGVLDLSVLAALKADANSRAARKGRGGCRIVDVCGPLGRALQPAVATGSGLRFGELAALTADKIDIGNVTIHVSESLIEEGGRRPYVGKPKNGKSREVAFAGWLADDLAEYVQARVRQDGKKALLWPAPAGGHLTRRNHSRWWLPVRDAAGWDRSWSWHGLRHLYAVTALAPATQGGWGMTLEDVSRLLGHHSPDFTARRYLTVRQGASQRAVAAARSATIDSGGAA